MLEEAKRQIKRVLTDKRYEHSLRVLETATELAEHFGANVEEVQLAAIYHDYAKDFSKAFLRDKVIQFRLPKDLLHYHHELWHGPVGALLVKENFNIQNRTVLSAIMCHTTGKIKMNLVEKIVFLADYIEPKRNFPAVEEVRKYAKEDLTYACWLVCRNNINHLMSKQALVYPDTMHAYNDFTRQLTERKNKTEGK